LLSDLPAVRRCLRLLGLAAAAVTKMNLIVATGELSDKVLGYHAHFVFARFSFRTFFRGIVVTRSLRRFAVLI